MAYIKYKEVTKYFNFSKALDKKTLPKYVYDYLFNNEHILVSYRTSRDYGIFTDKKIVLFDNTVKLGMKKQVFTIPYKSISTYSIVYKPRGAEVSLFLDSGYPLRLKFVSMTDIDKLRLRYLYSAMSKIIMGEKLEAEELIRLENDDFSFKD